MKNELQSPPVPNRAKIIACASVIKEMLPYIPAEMAYEILDFGLHNAPDSLRHRLQDSLDEDSGRYDTIILGYGLCSMAVTGLQSRRCNLVIPRVDDCIAIFLGSGRAYHQQFQKEPGTYYMTGSWIEFNDTPLKQYRRIENKHGRDRAEMVLHAMLKNYRRLVYIDTGLAGQEEQFEHARQTADKFGWQFEQMIGSNCLLRKMIFGPWDEDFVVYPPGQTIQYTDFVSPQACENEQK